MNGLHCINITVFQDTVIYYMEEGSVSAGTNMFFSLNPRTGLLQVVSNLRNTTYGNFFQVNFIKHFAVFKLMKQLCCIVQCIQPSKFRFVFELLIYHKHLQ